MKTEISRQAFDQQSSECWGKIEERLPEDITDEQKLWVKNYFEAQVAFSQRDSVEAYKIFSRLDDNDGYLAFEDGNPSLFAAIDIAVRKKSNRKVEPLFKLKP
jgi:hypothetical protein